MTVRNPRGLWLALVSVLLACSEGPLSHSIGENDALTPTASLKGRNPNPGAPSATVPDLRQLAIYRVPPRPTQVQAVIGPQGGSLRNADFEVVVPAGAVDRPTWFRIRLPNSRRAYAEFDASRAFLLPVTIRLPQASTNAPREARVLWWAGFRWVELPTKPTGDGRIEAQTTHFSIYGTSWFFKGITTLGG